MLPWSQQSSSGSRFVCVLAIFTMNKTYTTSMTLVNQTLVVNLWWGLWGNYCYYSCFRMLESFWVVSANIRWSNHELQELFLLYPFKGVLTCYWWCVFLFLLLLLSGINHPSYCGPEETISNKDTRFLRLFDPPKVKLCNLRGERQTPSGLEALTPSTVIATQSLSLREKNGLMMTSLHHNKQRLDCIATCLFLTFYKITE